MLKEIAWFIIWIETCHVMTKPIYGEWRASLFLFDLLVYILIVRVLPTTMTWQKKNIPLMVKEITLVAVVLIICAFVNIYLQHLFLKIWDPCTLFEKIVYGFIAISVLVGVFGNRFGSGQPAKTIFFKQKSYHKYPTDTDYRIAMGYHPYKNRPMTEDERNNGPWV